jgi:hypothetical protein
MARSDNCSEHGDENSFYSYIREIIYWLAWQLLPSEIYFIFFPRGFDDELLKTLIFDVIRCRAYEELSYVN